MNSNEAQNTSGIPESSSTKPMDSKRDVEKSPDPKTDQDFPGYPHYPAKEDIMGQESGHYRVDANIEEMGAGPNASGVSQRFATGNEPTQNEYDTPAEGESDGLAAVNSTSDEIGAPQNVSNEDLESDEGR